MWIHAGGFIAKFLWVRKVQGVVRSWMKAALVVLFNFIGWQQRRHHQNAHIFSLFVCLALFWPSRTRKGQQKVISHTSGKEKKLEPI